MLRTSLKVICERPAKASRKNFDGRIIFPIHASFPQQLLITLLINRLAVGEISHRSRSNRIA